MTDEVTIVPPRRDGKVVVLDRIRPGFLPGYCIYGRATCAAPGCTEWVYLGDQTYQAVVSGQAMPCCLECATALIGPETPPRGAHPRPQARGRAALMSRPELADEDRVAAALGAHPGRSAAALHQHTGLPRRRVTAALHRLDADNRIVARLADGELLYRATTAAEWDD